MIFLLPFVEAEVLVEVVSSVSVAPRNEIEALLWCQVGKQARLRQQYLVEEEREAAEEVWQTLWQLH